MVVDNEVRGGRQSDADMEASEDCTSSGPDETIRFLSAAKNLQLHIY